jgi:hypothetical protein
MDHEGAADEEIAAAAAEDAAAEDGADSAMLTEGQKQFVASELAKDFPRDLNEAEEARLLHLRRTNISKLNKGELHGEVQLRARKRKSLVQREDDHSVRSHAKSDWLQLGFVKIARAGDGDR